jgi:hypothetical protein
MSLQATGIYPCARQAVHIQQRGKIKYSYPCYKRTRIIPSSPTDLNGLKIFNDHLILD